MNYITRYVRYAIECSLRDLYDDDLFEALQSIYDTSAETYFLREFGSTYKDTSSTLGKEIYHYGYTNIHWDDLDVAYWRQYREKKFTRDEELAEPEDDYTTDEEE